MKDKDCNHTVGFDYLNGMTSEKMEWVLYSEALDSPRMVELVPINQFFIFCPWCGVEIKKLPSIRAILDARGK